MTHPHFPISALVLTLVAAMPASARPADSPEQASPPTSSPPASAPAALPPAGTLPASAPDRQADWSEDIDLLALTLKSKHKDAFTITSREQFEAAINDLKQRLGGLTDIQTYYELKRVVAMVSDAHTTLSDGKGRFATPYLPISVLVLADGVFVTASTAEHRDLMGAKVMRIGETPIDEAIDRLGSLIPHENRAWVLGQVNMLILTPPALAFVGLMPTAEQVSITVVDDAGKERTIALEPMRPGDRQTASPGLEQAKLALTMRGRALNSLYGSMMLPDSKDFYVWFDACRNDKNTTVAQFCKATLQAIERDKPDRIIIDLRRNSGGNSALIQPLVSGLAKSDDGHSSGKLFALIGRGTFSSGLWAAEDFKRQCGAILVGGPTGGKPNSFGEQKSVELPHSGLTLTYSTKKWTRDPDGDPESLMPDVRAELTYADLTHGKDTAIDAVRAYKPK